LVNQGVNIFNLSDPFYTDCCFMYNSPNGKDTTCFDRINAFYPNVPICESGCILSSIDLNTFEATCKCKMNDLISSASGIGIIIKFNISTNFCNIYICSIFIKKWIGCSNITWWCLSTWKKASILG